MDELNQTLTRDFASEYENIQKRYHELQEFGINYIESLLSTNSYSDILNFLRSSSFDITKKIRSLLIETGDLDLLIYLHEIKPLNHEDEPKVTMENLNWLLSNGVKPNQIFLLCSRQGNIKIMNYLLEMKPEPLSPGKFAVSISALLRDNYLPEEILLDILKILKENKIFWVNGCTDPPMLMETSYLKVMMWLYPMLLTNEQGQFVHWGVSKKNLEFMKWFISTQDNVGVVIGRTLQNRKLEDIIFLHEAGYEYTVRERQWAATLMNAPEIQEWFVNTYGEAPIPEHINGGMMGPTGVAG